MPIKNELLIKYPKFKQGEFHLPQKMDRLLMKNQMFNTEFQFLLNGSAAKRTELQRDATALLFENYRDLLPSQQTLERDPFYPQFRSVLSESSEIFSLTAVQKEIYGNDTGTAMIPEALKNKLLNIRCRFVVRPVNLPDLQKFVETAYRLKAKYTVRGAGTWPFGGAVPVNNEIVLDLSYLDFHTIDHKNQRLTAGAGVIFADMRKYLRDNGFELCQQITNPNSGTICGWIVTGGLGIGAYKYGPVRNSVEAIYLLTPEGQWEIVTSDHPLFEAIFESEGQIGIVAGVTLKVKPLSYKSKPYAFSFSSADEVCRFLKLLKEWQLTPSSILYYDSNYLHATYEIALEKAHHTLNRAVTKNEELKIRKARRDIEIAQQLRDLQHVVVMEFDEQADYEKALRYHPFNSRSEQSRYHDLPYWRLGVGVAHKLWDHRFAPVEMKQRGPSMLVSEAIIPLENLPAYMKFVQSAVTNWTGNPVKNEAHVLPNNEVMIQSILLADTQTRRHKIYFALVPFMQQTAIEFGGRPYGIGIWNLPFLNVLRQRRPQKIAHLQKLKERLDVEKVINQSKFINASGRKTTLKLFKNFSPVPMKWAVSALKKGWEHNGNFFIGKLLWQANKAIFPTVVPPALQADRNNILKTNIVCAECDSCEKVCPTSDVFGMWGIATPITRRKTANRIAMGIEIDQAEALGFLVCTRCDNCTRVCPTDIELTDMFDEVEANPLFRKVLGLTDAGKKDFIERFWDIMKESPLYIEHTKAVQKEERSHLQHGLEIKYPRGFAYSKLYIDEDTCISCGMCSHENACIYGARRGNPREIPQLIDENCALCNACINFCPQNKAIQVERNFIDDLIENAVDKDEKTYWYSQKQFLSDTTTIQRSPALSEMSDIYVSPEILMEIDKEASTGQIPVSGMGQGDRHMGIGFDAERFSHFHIVGPAQNRLHEGDPDEELSVQLGPRHRYCKFDEKEHLNNPPFPKIRLNTPMMYNHIRLQSNGRVELALIKVAEQQQTLVTIKLNRILEYYDFWLSEGNYHKLPRVVVPRVDLEMIDHIRVNPHVNRDLLLDLWDMPMFEVTPHSEMARTIDYIHDSAKSLHGKTPLICGYIEVSEYDIVAGEILPDLKALIESFMSLEVDVLHIHGLRNKDQYFVTSGAVRDIHHYLLNTGRRHRVSIIASGGIRLASDSQKTVQRGAEATLLDFAALLALDPYAYRAILENQATTEKLINLDIDWAVKRLNNQMESRKIQILEVLGAAGFKDIKKTVGEEGRLIDFYELEERLQKNVLEKEDKLTQYETLNREVIAAEPLPPGISPKYSELKKRVVTLRSPHYFYELGEVNQSVYQRDHVWPGALIKSLGRMAAGDPEMFQLKNVKGTGLLGDGFDVMKILYQRDPDIIPEEELDQVSTALPLDKDLILQAPWMLGGKSVGSIGLDTWRSHVIASRELGIQYDTGEGGYPTSFFLNSKGEPIFFTEPEMSQIKRFFEHDRHYTVAKIKQILNENGITETTHPGIFETLQQYPELQPFLFYEVIGEKDEPYVSTELKTGLFGVTKETIKKARRVVIAYSQGAKMGIGGHILAGKVNKLVSYLRGIQGLEKLNLNKLESLINRIEKIEQNADHPLNAVARNIKETLFRSHADQEIYPELKRQLWLIQQQAYQAHEASIIDPLDFEHILRDSEEIISYAYTSVISPFPFHNCYSIEDVKSFIDMVRMINPKAVVSVKVSPSVDIEFIAAGLARIAKDNTEEALKDKVEAVRQNTLQLSGELADYARRYGMKIEVWLDGPRGGTGASPNIIKGQMGMHLEYAIPLIHDRLVRDGLRNHVKFIVSGGIRTYEDVIKAVALGADGVVWGTMPLVAIGCDRNRNCHDGCSRGIATSNLIMQNLRDVDINSRQMINALLIMQMQVIRALAGLGIKDIRELRGRFDKIQWIGLKERVDFRIRQRREHSKHKDDILASQDKTPHEVGQTNCGVAAVIGTHPVPSYILDEALHAMKNRGMDGVGVGKTLCFPEHPHHYAYRIMVKGRLQLEMEADIRRRNGKTRNEAEIRAEARTMLLKFRHKLAEKIKTVFLDPYFDYAGKTVIKKVREPYKHNVNGKERDYREFGNANTDPGDIFRFFVRVKPNVLTVFIEEALLKSERFAYIREYFSEITRDNYTESTAFMQKAEDLFVFNHSTRLTQVLYQWEITSQKWLEFLHENDLDSEMKHLLTDEDPFSKKYMDRCAIPYLQMLSRFVDQYPLLLNREHYQPRQRKIAAVMSCGKNFAVWKTAGREIPWETPAAPNNIIHVRLATGSVVEQMNAHPFAKLHTALTHNGETTNYETLKQRVEQFGLPPLATTDTEVASLKFHLVADELQYPDWAMFEAFSPTTGDDLALVNPKIRPQLEEVQRVEFTSSPDGPYQYLCLRHLPERNTTERVDLKDPADLRPGTSVFWYDQQSNEKRAFSIIASEEQACQKVLNLLDREGLIDGSSPDYVMVSNGMINRFYYDDSGKVVNYELIDRYGQEIILQPTGKHYAVRREKLQLPKNASKLLQTLQTQHHRIHHWIREELPAWDFNTFHWVLEVIAGTATPDLSKANGASAFRLAVSDSDVLTTLTYFIDYSRTMDTGGKAQSSIADIAKYVLEKYFDQLPAQHPGKYVHAGIQHNDVPLALEGQVLLVDATGFEPEGTDPHKAFAAFLSLAYDRGWRKYILYRVNGQRLISTAVMGKDDTEDVEIDVFGTPGEYFAAFMQGGTIRCHGNAQNFTAMGMHHGNLYVFGNAGKVNGYASKGGKVFILGDIVDRAWTNSVNDPRCQPLQVHILGSASKYCGESLMGGDFFFGGLYFDQQGKLRMQARPYRGTKLMGGASRGRFLFFDPHDRLDPHQYSHAKQTDINDTEWVYWKERVIETLRLAGVEIFEHEGQQAFLADEQTYSITPDNFRLLVPKGGQKGYESH